VATWRLWWDGHDYFVLKSNYQGYIIVAVHFSSLMLLMMLQVGTILYGPGGLNNNYEGESVDQLNSKEYFQTNPKLKFFVISFFSKNS
jgi:hypothetical protein